MLKLHKLFLNDGHPHSFDEVITPTEDQRKTLVGAKNAIRDHLRERIRAATTTILGMDKMVSPRFRTQGSWAYKTCVQSAHRPPQEIDWDFGVYLPVTVWTEQDPPPLMAKLYFDLVERALNDLCQQRGWTLDRSKTTCARVQVADWAHIDVPLYAAPEDKFREVVEKAMASNQIGQVSRESITLDESIDFGEMPGAFWEQMDGIHLATRDGKWKPSDPEAVALWFNDRVEEHGVQLRRVCRYLKAWRDHHWRDGGGPSSVLIMILIAQAFQPSPRRDDLAVESAARLLADGLRRAVFEPGIDGGDEDFNRLGAQERSAAAALADEFARQLKVARSLSPGLTQVAVDTVRTQFGTRIADNVAFVEPDAGADVVRRTPASSVLPPVVGASQAG